jgi:hypothetical protein
MNELLLDRAMSSAMANLRFIKMFAHDQRPEVRKLIEVAADCSQHSLVCARSCEAGSVLPETMDLWCESCQAFADLAKASSIESTELAACAEACENCIRVCHRQGV